MLSIIIPCYNIENYITGCLESLHRQTSQDFQLILVDDASTDDTIKRIQDYPYLKEFKAVEIVELSENSGVSNARNIGVSSARGGYYVFVDGDDQLEDNAVETINTFTTSNDNLDIVAFDAFLCGSNGAKSMINFGVASLESQMQMAVRGYWSVVWRFAYRTDFMRVNNFMMDTSLSGGEDYLFVCQVLSKAKSFGKIEKPLYDYATANEGSAMTRINLRGLNDQIDATNKVAELLNQDATLKPYVVDLNYRNLYIKKLIFKTSLKIWRSWKPQSNAFAGGGQWRLKDRLVFKIISLLSKGL
jgi:glycosyltransferase involved in cell wall biosynthesis